MIFGKETETLEFKKTTGELKEAVKSIAAILNKNGKGELYFGVKDDGTIVGHQIGKATLRDVSRALAENLKPQISPTIDVVAIGDKNCIRVAFEGNDPPYYAFGRAHIRVADENKQMSTDELEAFIIRKHERASFWDSCPSRVGISGIDAAVLEKYVGRANAAGRLNYQYTDAQDILGRLKLLGNGALNNAAVAMFGKDPGIEIKMAIFATKEKLTFNDLYRTEGRILDLIDAAERYIRNAMRYRVVIDGSQISRKEIPEVPHVAIREALVNSFCHKNYKTPQSNEVAIYSDRIEIYNPGTFPTEVKPEDFIKGKGRPIQRNPLLAKILYNSKDIEDFGTGLKRIADACKLAGVRYDFVQDNIGFTVVFYRPPLWTSDDIEVGNGERVSDVEKDLGKGVYGGRDVDNDVERGDSIVDSIVDGDTSIVDSIVERGASIVDSIVERGASIVDSIVDEDKSIVDSIVDGDVSIVKNGLEMKIIEIMRNNPKVSATQLSEAIGIASRNVQAHIKSLKDLGYIQRSGSPRGGHWVVNTGGK